MSFIIRGTNAPQKQDIYIISKTRHLFLHELYFDFFQTFENWNLWRFSLQRFGRNRNIIIFLENLQVEDLRFYRELSSLKRYFVDFLIISTNFPVLVDYFLATISEIHIRKYCLWCSGIRTTCSKWLHYNSPS